MKIKTSELKDTALDWAVGQAHRDADLVPVAYSTDWAFGGLIIEREQVSLVPDLSNGSWCARIYTKPRVISYDGSTPLTAAMRCYVASKLGDEVEVPDELKGE